MNPYTVTLASTGAAALVVAVLLAFAGQSATDVDEGATMAAWSDFLLLVGVVALIGAGVVAGVRWTLRRAGLDV